MRKQSRIVRIGKWAGLIGCLIIVGAWGVSLYRVTWTSLPGITFLLSDDSLRIIGPGALHDHCRNQYGWFHSIPRKHPDPVMVGLLAYYGALYEEGSLLRAWMVNIPLWMPLVALAIPTFLLWRRDKRIPKGHCQNCGYNLMCNVSGRCPECGLPIPVSAKHSGESTTRGLFRIGRPTRNSPTK